MESNGEKVQLLEAEIEQLKLQLSDKDSKLADFSQKAKAAITKLKGEIATLQASGAPQDVVASDSSLNIQELIKARDDALEEVSKVKEQAKKHLQKIKTQHAEELAALRHSLQTSGTASGECHADANVKSDQELMALKEELVKVNFIILSRRKDTAQHVIHARLYPGQSRR
jgi:chromosome segregation ATPase